MRAPLQPSAAKSLLRSREKPEILGVTITEGTAEGGAN